MQSPSVDVSTSGRHIILDGKCSERVHLPAKATAHVPLCIKITLLIVAWSVCLCVGHVHETCKTTEPIKMALGVLTQVCLRNHI